MSIASPAISFDHSDSMATITIGVSDYVIAIATGPIKTLKNFIWEGRKERVSRALVMFVQYK